jgi:hypothetical protein
VAEGLIRHAFPIRFIQRLAMRAFVPLDKAHYDRINSGQIRL